MEFVLGVAATIITGAVTALVTARLTRKSEHERWLRDQRMEAYGALLAAATRMTHLMVQSGNNAEKLTAFGALETAYGAVDVLGPADAREAARALFTTFTTTKGENGPPEQIAAHNAFRKVATTVLNV